MNGENYTPGPWRVPDHETHVLAEDGGVCKFESIHGFYDNYQANAHLIAAAPDMYEALRDAAESLRFAADELKAQASIPDADERDLRESRNKVFNALKKARGEDT